MKRWILRKISNLLGDDPKHIGSQPDVVREDPDMRSDAILNFRVFDAVGGKVVEFVRYDRKTDRRNTTTYIITNDQDFGERISKIATMEQLKN